MDQNPKDLPILSYVLSQLNPNSHPRLPPQLQQTLLTQLPYLNHPKVLASLAQAIPDITQITKSVRLEERHEEYEKQLREAEDRLVEVYGSVVSELEKGFKEGEVCDEVVGILKEAEGGVVVERVELCGRQLRFLPEAFGMLHGLLVLNLSHNQLEVSALVIFFPFLFSVHKSERLQRKSRKLNYLRFKNEQKGKKEKNSNSGTLLCDQLSY